MKVNHSGHWPEHMAKAAYAARAVIRLLGRGRLVDPVLCQNSAF